MKTLTQSAFGRLFLSSMSTFCYTATFLVLTACGQQQFEISRTSNRILVIGDSISIGWTPYASIKSQNRYQWHRLTNGGPNWSTWPENARNTNYTLRNVEEWLNWFPGVDTVIWNNGVWNTTPMGYYTPGEDPRNYGTTVEQYNEELIQIARILKSRVRRVIFVTTTPSLPSMGFEYQKVDQFNAIAKAELPGLGIEILDMNAFVAGHNDWYISSTDVHYNTLGVEKQSEFVVDYLDQTRGQ